MKKKAKGFFPFGYVSVPSTDPGTILNFIWCFNEVGKEAIGVAFAPSATPNNDLRNLLARAAIDDQGKLIPCEGVLNEKSFQCCGPFRIRIGKERCIFHTVNWTRKTGGMRAFLILGARDCGHALAMLRGLHKKDGSKRKGLLASDTIKMVLEFENLFEKGQMRPQKDFEFAYAKKGS